MGHALRTLLRFEVTDQWQQACSAAGAPALHRARRAAENPGRFLDRVSLHIHQHQSCPLITVQGAQRGRDHTALLVVVALWALVVGIIYLRTRAYLMVDGARLTVRRFRRFVTIEGADLIGVSEFLTPNGPSYRLTVRGSDGHSTRVVAPVALCAGGMRPSSHGY